MHLDKKVHKLQVNSQIIMNQSSNTINQSKKYSHRNQMSLKITTITIKEHHQSHQQPSQIQIPHMFSMAPQTKMEN